MSSSCCCCSGVADHSVELRYQPTSPGQRQRLWSAEESDALLEAVLTQRTSNLLSDPDVQKVLRKSYSLDDLASSEPQVRWSSFQSACPYSPYVVSRGRPRLVVP